MQNKRSKLSTLLKNYRSNVPKIWDIRANEIYVRWREEKGDYGVIAEILNAIKPASLLDIGYGYGRLAPLYCEIPYVVGMDVSQSMLDLAKENSKANIQIKTVLGDIRQMPFNDSFFSCIISVRTLNHIHTDDFVMVEQEISRVCRDVVILLESDVKIPDAEYEFEHNYDTFLLDTFIQTKTKLEENVYLRIFHRKASE